MSKLVVEITATEHSSRKQESQLNQQTVLTSDPQKTPRVEKIGLGPSRSGQRLSPTTQPPPPPPTSPVSFFLDEVTVEVLSVLPAPTPPPPSPPSPPPPLFVPPPCFSFLFSAFANLL